MAFNRRTAPTASPGPGGVAAACVRSVCWGATRLVLSVAVALVLVGVLLVLRLMQGPLELPALGRLVADQINAQSDEVRVSARTMVLTLGDGRVPSGLEFRDVKVVSLDGNPLFSVPRVGTSFEVSDLLQGHVRPVRFSIVEADAQFIQAPDGRIRFGLGHRAGIALDEGGGGTEGLDAVNAIIDSFVGDAPPIDELVRLQRIEIIGANLIYDDRMHGGHWTTRDAHLRIWRNSQGAQALLTVDDIRPDGPGSAVRVRATRRPGDGITSVRASFGRLDTVHLARQLPGLSWLNAFGATLEGAVNAQFDDRGNALAFDGEVIAERGRIGGPDGFPFRQITARFALDPDSGQMAVEHARVLTDDLDVEVAGFAGLKWTDGIELPTAAAQIDVLALRLDQEGLFEDPLVFDRGQLALRWVPQRQRVEFGQGWLGREGLAISVQGQILTDGPVIGDLRAEVAHISARDLEKLWPLQTAPNARTWFATNILKADIRDLVIQTRIGPGEPDLTFDFTFHDLDSTYIRGMTPIRDATGLAHLNYNELHLDLDRGHVTPAKGLRLDLDGSRMSILDFNGAVTLGKVDLVARGRTAGVMALINQKPLSLIDRLGIDLGRIDGTSRVTADLQFPLSKKLKIEQVRADATAQLEKVRMDLPVAGETLAVAANALTLQADTKGLSLKGKARIDGAPVTVGWREVFRKKSRELDLAGTLTPKLLAQFGVTDLPFEGQAGFDLDLAQTGSGPMQFSLKTDLKPASLKIEALDWTKPKGARGTLTAAGEASADGLRVDKLVLETGTLRANGAMTIKGKEIDARFARVRLPGRMDVAAHIRSGADGVPQAWLTGAMLDISQNVDGAGDGGERSRDRFSLRLDVRELRVSDKIVLKPAKGSVSRARDGILVGELDGRLAPKAPIRIEFQVPPKGEGGLLLTSPDAGEALRAADLYRDARGGTLWLSAKIGSATGADLAGQIRIEDVRVRSKSTFQRVLRAGGLEEAETVVTQSGIAFRKIWVPFSYSDGVVTLTDAIAVSPMLGLKLNGTLNEDSEQVDMIGVMSPAYALTGALNNVPVLGRIFAGGEGEGILAMTFTLKGQMRDPRFSVNPLSLLTPGFMRRLFTRRGGGGGDGTRDRGLNPSAPVGSDR